MKDRYTLLNSISLVYAEFIEAPVHHFDSVPEAEKAITAPPEYLEGARGLAKLEKLADYLELCTERDVCPVCKQRLSKCSDIAAIEES